jgi:hypothetical protein
VSQINNLHNCLPIKRFLDYVNVAYAFEQSFSTGRHVATTLKMFCGQLKADDVTLSTFIPSPQCSRESCNKNIPSSSVSCKDGHSERDLLTVCWWDIGGFTDWKTLFPPSELLSVSASVPDDFPRFSGIVIAFMADLIKLMARLHATRALKWRFLKPGSILKQLATFIFPKALHKVSQRVF